MSEICFGELSTARQPLETRSRGELLAWITCRLFFDVEQLLDGHIDLSDYVFARMS